MGDLTGRLAQQQTPLGGRVELTATASFPHQSQIIELGIETQQRQGEPVLAPRLAMAGTRIAAIARQQRLNVELKGDRRRYPWGTGRWFGGKQWACQNRAGQAQQEETNRPTVHVRSPTGMRWDS